MSDSHSKENQVSGYKAFEKNLVCRNVQYSEDTIFEMEEFPKVCERGFHFCENPLDILDHYDIVDSNGELSEFAKVESIGNTDFENNIIATNKIKIGKKLNLVDFIISSYDYLYNKFKKSIDKTVRDDKETKIVGYGHNVQIINNSDEARIMVTGSEARIAGIGYNGYLVNHGNYGRLISTGYYSQLVSIGKGARIASSGNESKLLSHGEGSILTSSGSNTNLNSKEANSIICGVGVNNRAKGVIGNWITLSEWEYDINTNEHKLLCVKTEKIDGVKIKENTWYKLVDGNFEECVV